MTSKTIKEKCYSKWLFDIVTTTSSKENILLSETCLCTPCPLLPSVSSIPQLFWEYFQLICLLWKEALCGSSNSLDKKLRHTICVAINLFEQSPEEEQECMMIEFCSSSDVVDVCIRIAGVAMKGTLFLFHQESRGKTAH